VSALNMALIVHRLQQSPRGWKVDDLCSELGIAPRTYRKYRKILQEEFIPFFKRGETLVQEVREEDGRYLRLVEPTSTDGEIAQLLTHMTAHHLARSAFEALQDRELSRALDDAFTAAWSRVAKSKGRRLRHLILDLDRLLHFVPDAPKDYSSHGEALTTVLGCLMRHQQVRLQYESASSEARDHDLEPLTLALYRGGLHLLARYPGKKRVYNFVIDRVRQATSLPDYFEYPDDKAYQPRKFTEDAFGIFFQARGGKRHAVELVFANIQWLKIYLRERTWHRSQVFEDLPDGRLRMRFKVPSLVEVEGWVRQFGNDVEIVAPAELIA
jgi:predicted DNA-binding transcriptional regulator YafY